MHTSLPATLLCCLLLMTAGCSGLTSDDSKQGVSATPIEVPEDPTYPPGVTEDGIQSVSALVSAHQSALANQSVTFHQETTATRTCTRVTSSEGEAFSCENSTIIYDGYVHGEYLKNRSYFLTHTFADSESMTEVYDDYIVRAYADGKRVYMNETQADNSTYRTLYDPDGEPIDPREVLYVNLHKESELMNYLYTMNIVTVERVQESPTERYRITAEGFEEPEQFADQRGVEAVSGGSLSLVVAETGAIQSFDVSYTQTTKNGRVHIEQSVTYTDWGNTTIDAPEWISKVNETGAPASDTATDEGR
ncbi:hypothetical protein [Haladaptatus sp. DJG-WS-42]|uniref:hypothetical protein n=1 Tax=Haladaptatus sp. DJG-WS-42 TaxID=3120516 RepID=UPI0030D212E4